MYVIIKNTFYVGIPIQSILHGNLEITGPSYVIICHIFPLRPFGPKLGNISRFFYAASRHRKTFTNAKTKYVSW